MANNVLGRAKADRYAEFYTRLSDIENELRYYRRHFRDKTVLCNCDDPYESAFFEYFATHFNQLRLRKLIATCYAGSPVAGTQLSFDDLLGVGSEGHAYKAIVTTAHDATGDGRFGMDDVAELFRLGENEISLLEGDGDYHSDECLALMDEADIVVTNPPFFAAQEFVKTLIDRGKRFLVIGPDTTAKYAEVFPHVKAGDVWLGVTRPKRFYVPESYPYDGARRDDDGRLFVQFGNIGWFTNLDVRRRHEDLTLVRWYDPEKYQSYTNFDGIHIEQVGDIPRDYAGNMGVPINFLDQHNPEQFEIVGLGEGNLAKEIGVTRDRTGRTKLEIEKDGKRSNVFARIVIRNLHPEKPRS